MKLGSPYRTARTGPYTFAPSPAFGIDPSLHQRANPGDAEAAGHSGEHCAWCADRYRQFAGALKRQQIGGAGLDVFEVEPLPNDHPLRSCPNAILTSHVAWYSEASVPRLQTLAAEEVVRGVRGEALKNRVNP